MFSDHKHITNAAKTVENIDTTMTCHFRTQNERVLKATRREDASQTSRGSTMFHSRKTRDSRAPFSVCVKAVRPRTVDAQFLIQNAKTHREWPK